MGCQHAGCSYQTSNQVVLIDTYAHNKRISKGPRGLCLYG